MLVIVGEERRCKFGGWMRSSAVYWSVHFAFLDHCVNWMMMWTYISGPVHGTAHDDHLLDSEESLWVCSRCSRKVSQRPNGNNSDGIRLIVSKQLQHLLMCGLHRRGKKRVHLLDFLQFRSFFSAERVRCGLEE